MIEAILPDWVKVVETIGPAEDRELEPAEAQSMRGAVDSRRREFATGRWCARAAMVRLGRAPAPIPRGENREPLWPEGIAGSITHTKGYCAAAVALDSEAGALGIDAEPDGPLPAGVLGKVATEAERAHLAALPVGVNWDRLLFSAKESVYKSLWPLVRDWIGFSDAEIRFEPDRGVFHATVTAPRAFELEGRYVVANGFALTAISLRKPLPQ